MSQHERSDRVIQYPSSMLNDGSFDEGLLDIFFWSERNRGDGARPFSFFFSAAAEGGVNLHPHTRDNCAAHFADKRTFLIQYM